MADDDVQQLRADAEARAYINLELTRRFAPEDDALRGAVAAAHAADMPAIQVSPLRGRLLQVLAAACGARKILEIGALAGYSGIWLARALPADGRFISLEVSAKHAEVARASLARAGVADRAEVRQGAGADLLPGLKSEAPFDLVFIDANKDGYPQYLEWALALTRPGSIIVADNCVRAGEPLRGDSADEGNRGIATYDDAIATNPRLRSIVLPMDQGMDGVAISVVVA
jgi:caffeoyl-CoA O-methyltransferase